MTAYGAAISLKNTIDYILHSAYISLVEPSRDNIQLAYNELQPLQESLKRLDSTSKSRSRKNVNALDGRIKDLIWEFEDSLESLLADQIQFQSQQDGLIKDSTDFQRLQDDVGSFAVALNKFMSQLYGRTKEVCLFSIDLHRLRDDVGSFVQTLKDMKEKYKYELENMVEDDDDDKEDETGFVFGGTKPKMIGLSDSFEQVKSYLTRTHRKMHIYLLAGMAGVGKTTLARNVFEDPDVVSHYQCRVWVTVGRKPQLGQLSRRILAQLCGIAVIERDGKISDFLIQKMEGKKCFIVLDDVWESKVLDSLISSLPAIKNRFFQILVTARALEVVDNITYGRSKLVRFLNDEESKDLLCYKVFGEDICPFQLDKAATKIAKKCEGLPLMILTVAGFLLKSQKKDDPKYWDEVAEERNSVFTEAYNKITKVLYPSYEYLPQHLKMPFLYMGVFPPDYDFPPSKLTNMLTAEGWFHNTSEKQPFEESVWECLDELCTRKYLVLFEMKSTLWNATTNQHRKFKSCRLHSTWRHVCRGEAQKNKFYQVLKRLVDGLQGVKGQRCLCLQNNILFGLKELFNSVRLNCASSTRSLLFYGTYHQYPIPTDVGFRFLRELDALNLRFYSFPKEFLTLVQLKYLALTCNGELPPTISKLFNLRVLIMHPHINIRRYRAPSYIPVQVWDMQELEHIEILGKSLVAPFPIASLEKLLTLVGVNANICTILELSRRIPNIRKLGVQIELTPYDTHNDLLSCFGCISTLENLVTLKCSITNPVVKYGYVFPMTPGSLKLPHGLKKLHLSGMGFPWEYMDDIGSLKFLRVLKLRSYAFQGSHWITHCTCFPSLEFLLIEDSDLVHWEPRYRFPKLSYLSMKHCYKLQVLDWLSDCWETKLELEDCNPLAFTYVRQMILGRHMYLKLTASFDKKPMTIQG